MDKYDLAIKYLTEHPEQIENAWMIPSQNKGGSLFQMAVRTLCLDAGCLTMIRHRSDVFAETPEITNQIKSDERIPDNASKITVDDLHVFAEWHRKLDRLFGERETGDDRWLREMQSKEGGGDNKILPSHPN